MNPQEVGEFQAFEDWWIDVRFPDVGMRPNVGDIKTTDEERRFGDDKAKFQRYNDWKVARHMKTVYASARSSSIADITNLIENIPSPAPPTRSVPDMNPEENQEFQDFDDWWFYERYPNIDLDDTTSHAEYRARDARKHFKNDKAKIDRYNKWVRDGFENTTNAAARPSSTTDITGLIDSSAIKGSIATLAGMLMKANEPFFPLGEGREKDTSYGYSMSTEAFVLRPHVTDDKLQGGFMNNLLGLNLGKDREGIPFEADKGVQSSSSGNQQQDDEPSKQDSSKINETDTPDTTNGFCFHQLGALIRFEGDWSSARHSAASAAQSDDRIDTGFVVVLKLTQTFKPDGIYVIYNVYQDVDWNGHRIEVTPEDQPQFCRLSPESENAFFVAKIAESIGELGMEARFRFKVLTPPGERVCQIVGTRDVDGRLLRQEVGQDD
ncbi:hypothetical protein EJ08DRAFT_702919 [Tothia fuscella]|uniref:Uncharacterized protein n=1 Tax=Tothia fuscella TaxID=1048955 RepID=A0A9P4TSR3_9PEZI|nr:hypothetical protein EJ08DRAFT_702919 [Tothia fuscella]